MQFLIYHSSVLENAETLTLLHVTSLAYCYINRIGTDNSHLNIHCYN